MSHFSVAVITHTKPIEVDLHKILQPFHEYECTGTKDEYVVWVDTTDKNREEWGKYEKHMVRLSDDSVHDRYSEQFYTGEPDDPNSFSPRKTFVLPEGAEEYTCLAPEVETLEEFSKGWDGSEPDPDNPGRVRRYTNPNAKWDGWVIGGRWTGHFQLNYNPGEDPVNQETCSLCHGTGTRTDMTVENGCNGCKGTGVSTKWPTQWVKNESDCVQVKDLPIDQLVSSAEQKAAQQYDEAITIIKDREFFPWKHCHEILFKDNLQGARDYYHDQQVIKDLREWDTWCSPENFLEERSTYIFNAGASSISTFALIKDGQWYQRGEMGWWACVSDEDDNWDQKWFELFQSLDPEAWVTIVDCHI